MKRNEDSLKDFWDSIKCTNIQIIVVPEEEKKGTGPEKMFKRLYSKTSLTWEGKEQPKSRKCRVPYRINPRRNMPRHILFKLSKIKCKEKILKTAREKQQIIYKGIPIRLSADFSAKPLQDRRDWQDIFKVMKRKNLQPRLLYPARVSFRFYGEIKSFTDKQKLKEFSTTKPALQQMLEELL